MRVNEMVRKWCTSSCKKTAPNRCLYALCFTRIECTVVIFKTSSVTNIANGVSTIKDITTLVRSSTKREKALQQSIGSNAAAQKSMSLTTLCETRWMDRNKNVTKFLEMFPNVLNTFKRIIGWSDTTAAAGASR